MQKNDFNKIVITGYIDTPPTLSHTVDRTPVSNFTLYTTNKSRTDNFDVTVWGELAKTVCNEFELREKILVEGFIQHRAWKKEDYETGNVVEIVAKRIYSIGNDNTACV